MSIGSRAERPDDVFKGLYQKYYWRVVRFFMRLHFSEEDAKDLAQDAFIRFYEAIDEYRGDAEWAFLETIARNVALNRFRAANTLKRKATTVDIDDPEVAVLEPRAAEEPDYAERQQRAIRQKLLYQAIAELPQGQRECIQLWLDDFQYDEIARALRITMDAVKSRLRDAKKHLRARLGDDAALPEDEP